MNILLYIGHPAHVHLLKNTYWQLQKHGHKVFVVSQNLPIACSLLLLYKIPFTIMGKRFDSIAFKMAYQIWHDINLALFVHKHRITIGMGASVALTHVSKLTKMKRMKRDVDDDAVELLGAT